jgi:hypothetical protein
MERTLEVVRQMADGFRFWDIGDGRRRVYRIWAGDDVRLVKFYADEQARDRELVALTALVGLEGMPEVLASGALDGLTYLLFADPGEWTLATLPDHRDWGEEAGRLLAAVHATDRRALGPLRAIDVDWVKADFDTALDHLARFQARLRLPAPLAERAAMLGPRFGSEPVFSHTDPTSGIFRVEDGGSMTLLHWDWARPAPVQWDVALAWHSLQVHTGPQAAAGFLDGYGADLDAAELRRWAVYHQVRLVVDAASEQGPHSADTAPLVEDLIRLVAVGHPVLS